MLVGDACVGVGLVGRRSAASVVSPRWVVVEKVESATKAKRVFVLVVEALALGFGPELVRVLR